MTKLKAFTITELMVVSVLGTICAAAVFSGIDLIQQQYFSYEKETEQLLAVGDLERQLEMDVLDALRVIREPEGLRLEKRDYDVVYVFTQDKIKRIVDLEGVRKKEFLFPVKNIRCYWESEPIDIGLLDFLELEIAIAASTMHFSMQKEYSAKQKIEFKNKLTH